MAEEEKPDAPTDWLEAPKVMIPAPKVPFDWLATTPKPDIGDESAILPSRDRAFTNFSSDVQLNEAGDDPRALAAMREKAAREREEKQLAASTPAPIPQTAPPAPVVLPKQSRSREPWKPNRRERAILGVPREAKANEYYERMTAWKLRDTWTRPGGPTTIGEAFKAKDSRLLKLIRDERSNVWKRNDKA